ncbi:hypothetical protein ABPG72_013868 [Tetrahymena utriculariae]
MIFSKLDLFASQFEFNISNQRAKGTLMGTILSFVVFSCILCYVIYIIQQYATSQIEPNFRSQSFISQDAIDISLNSDLVGFQFSYGYPPLKNQTYFVVLAYFYLVDNDNFQMVPLNIFDCTNPDLQGFQCLDFSPVSNYTLSLNTKQNQQSQLWIMTYGCQDLDQFKTTVPNNCANQTEIDNMINNSNSRISLKLFTSQYNTSSQEIQSNYRNVQVFTVSTYQILTQVKAQKQITTVKQGVFFQSPSVFSSPIQYDQTIQTIDRQQASQLVGVAAFSCIFISIDEIVQQIQVNYLTLPQIMTSVYSMLNILLLLGIIGTAISKKSIQRDFQMVFLKNQYQDNYLQILQLNEQQQKNQTQNNEQQLNQNQSDFEINRYEENSKKREELQEQNQGQQSFTIQPIFNQSPPQDQQQSDLRNQDEKINNTNSIQKENSKEKLREQKYTFYDEIKIENLESSNTGSPQLKYKKNNQTIDAQSSLQISSPNYSCSQQRDFSQANTNPNSLLHSVLKSNSEQYQIQEINKNGLKKSSLGNFMQKLKDLQSEVCQNKVKQIISKLIFCKKRYKSSIKGLNEKQQKAISQNINKDLDILNMVSDLLFLKKAVLLMLTSEQLAILQLIGCSSNFLELDLKNIDYDLSQVQQKNLNHYEIQLAITQSKSLQQYCLQKFLSRCSSKDQNLSIYDKKLLSTLLQSYKY